MAQHIAIVGPGAVGATLAGSFAASGAEVCLLGRPGPRLSAIARHGLLLRGPGGTERYRFAAAADPADLPVPDTAVLCVKGQALPEAAARIEPWLARGTEVLVVVNGVPWWLLATVPEQAAEPVVRSVDPDGALLRLLPPERVMAGVAHFSSSVSASGEVVHASGSRLIIGEPLGGVSDRVRRCAGALAAGPVRAEPSADVRTDVWEKLLGNVNLNPVSALTGGTVLEIIEDPGARRLCASMFTETAQVGDRLGIGTALSADQRLDIARQLGAFRTSMLQDADRGRPLELAPILGAVRELAGRTGVPCPALDAVHALLALREQVRHRG